MCEQEEIASTHSPLQEDYTSSRRLTGCAALRQVLPEVLKLHTAPLAGQRCVAVTAVKVATVPQPHPIDDALRPAMLPLLQLISDPDRCVPCCTDTPRCVLSLLSSLAAATKV